MTDARDRRRERAESKKKVDVGATIKKLRVPIVIVILWAAIVGFNVAQGQGLIGDNAENCPGHWHSTMDFFVDGERVAFPQGPYKISGEGGKLPLSSHMHAPDDRTWHWEPSTVTCLDFRDAMDKVDVDMRSDAISFDGSQTITGTFVNNETHSWKAYTSEYEAGWETSTISKISGRQLLDGERVVFVYSPIDDDGAALRDNVGPMSQGVSGATDDPTMFIAITMTSIFALIGLMIWWNFAKKTW